MTPSPWFPSCLGVGQWNTGASGKALDWAHAAAAPAISRIRRTSRSHSMIWFQLGTLWDAHNPGRLQPCRDFFCPRYSRRYFPAGSGPRYRSPRLGPTALRISHREGAACSRSKISLLSALEPKCSRRCPGDHSAKPAAMTPHRRPKRTTIARRRCVPGGRRGRWGRLRLHFERADVAHLRDRCC